jgi:hypothetical protein
MENQLFWIKRNVKRVKSKILKDKLIFFSVSHLSLFRAFMLQTGRGPIRPWPTYIGLRSVSSSFHMVLGDLEQEFLAKNPGYPAYTSHNCQLVERQQEAVNWLNCSLIFFPPVAGTTFCSPLQTTLVYTNAS